MRGPEPIFTPQHCRQFRRARFRDYPYLIVHPVVGINHILLVPRALAPPTLYWIAQQQRTANRLPVTIALSEQMSMVYPLEGQASLLRRDPFPGFPVTGAIEGGVRFRRTAELQERAARLDDFVRKHRMRGFRFGDPWKDGRRATIEEAQWLFGRQAEGVPAGLRRCAECGDWRGECLDPELGEAYGEDFVVPVRCRCENWNRCARCHRPFEGRRLNSNYYDPRDGNIWFVSGMHALDHRC